MTTQVTSFIAIPSDQNANIIRGVLEAHPEGITYSQLCKETHLSSSTAYEALARLIAQVPELTSLVVIPSDKNTNLVQSALRAHPEGLTRSQLCKEIHLPRTTIYDALARLLALKRVTKDKVKNWRKGRPRVCWKAVLF